MTTTKNNEHKKLNFSNEREQSQACLNSAEHEKNQGRKVLNVPNLRFPEFQGEWKKCTLNEVCKFHNGRAYKQTELLAAGKYRVLRVGNFFTNDSWYYSNLELEDNKYAQNGDLLYAWSASFGPRFWREEKVIFHYHIWKIDSFKNVDKNFLYHFLDLDSAKIKNEVQGGTMVHITKGDMEKRTISYPSVPEQRNIARFLFLLDERIATQNKIIDKLQTLIKGISSRIFASIQGIEYRMGDIVTITNGNSNVQDAVTLSKDGLYPFFDRSEDIKYLPTFLFDKEAIIYPGEGTEFMPRYFKGKFALHQRCYAIFDFNEIINARFLYFYLKTQNSYFVKNAVGSTVPSLRLDTFQKLKVIIPPKKIQHSVSLCLSSMEQKCNVEKKILHKLLKQKQYLLRQMFI